MNPDIDLSPAAPEPPLESLAKATSELNNLLQVISGTSSLIEHVCREKEDTAKQLEVMRASIERAEKLAAELVKQAGGPEERILKNQQVEKVVAKSTSSQIKKKPSILVVDDEQMALALMCRILTEGGFKATTAQSGFECLDHFRRSPYQFDLVLLDFSMPFMDGEETFNRLREIRPDMPVVICTGFIQQERLQRLMTNGLAGFLRKPLAPDEIVEHIQAILASVKYSRPGISQGVPAVV